MSEPKIKKLQLALPYGIKWQGSNTVDVIGEREWPCPECYRPVPHLDLANGFSIAKCSCQWGGSFPIAGRVNFIWHRNSGHPPQLNKGGSMDHLKPLITLGDYEIFVIVGPDTLRQ